MILLAIIFPALSFLLRGKILTFFLCLILQFTLIGWIPASLWAVFSLINERNDKKLNRIMNDLENIKGNQNLPK